jgi:hypothetical protein
LGKHAYMIIAHNDFDILQKLLVLLDDSRNDIFLHIDSKVKNFNFDMYKSIPTRSNIYYVPRISVNWGGYTLIECELTLLKEAAKKKYDYYHLLSGVDLPLKTQDQIHTFFDKHKGTEFVHFSTAEIKRLYYRVNRYHFLQEYLRVSNNRYINLCVKAANAFLLGVQKFLGVNRLKNSEFALKYGSQWFSITDDLANYVIQSEEWIQRYFSLSSCADELFIQTLIYYSKFKEKLPVDYLNGSHLNCMRNIDWNRGNPYVWRNHDFDELLDSDYLFARKFNTNVDEKIVNKIYENILDKTNSRVLI